MSRSGDTVVDVDEIASKNASVDLAKVKKAGQAVEKLRELGVSSHKFDLSPPFQRQSRTTLAPRMARVGRRSFAPSHH